MVNIVLTGPDPRKDGDAADSVGTESVGTESVGVVTGAQNTVVDGSNRDAFLAAAKQAGIELPATLGDLGADSNAAIKPLTDVIRETLERINAASA